MQEKSDEETMIVIEGVISEFYWDRGTVNLLEKIQKQSKAKNAAVGLVAAATDMYGVLASSAMLVMYDGEDVENFICRLGGKVVCGQFSGADHLKDGDQVKAVVTPQGEVYLAHAVLRPLDEVIWMPVGVYRGSSADHRSNIRMAMRLTVALYIVLTIVGYFLSNSKPLDGQIIAMFVFFPPILAFTLGAWAHKDFLPMALRAEKIFRVLCFPYPEDIDMFKGYYFGSKSDNNLSSNMLSMFYYQKAINFEVKRQA